MKSPLEHLPADQLNLSREERISARAQLVGGNTDLSSGGKPSPVNPLNKVYPWLLALSLCLSGLLCWLYVTKPLIAQVPAVSHKTNDQPVIINHSEPNTVVAGIPREQKPIHPALMPSDHMLPGGDSQRTTKTKPSGQAVNITNNRLAGLQRRGAATGTGWESTNLKVQHILSADSGTGELEKIILNVPVRYETRTMRWTPEDIKKARNVLARLVVYERDLHNLRQQGGGILKDWNQLLKVTLPVTVLRADSPSLHHESSEISEILSDGSAVIKVDEPKVNQE